MTLETGEIEMPPPELEVLSLTTQLLSVSVPRFMMVSTNVDSALFRREMDMLGELLGGLAAESPDGMTVIPGHGDYYLYPPQASG